MSDINHALVFTPRHLLPLLTGLFLAGGIVIWYSQSQLEGLTEMAGELRRGEKESGSRAGEVFGIQAQPFRPPSLPEEIPLYSPATLLGVTETKRATQVILETEASEDILIEFYDRRLRPEGWQKEGQAKYSKGDHQLELKLIPDLLQPLTTIILTYSRK